MASISGSGNLLKKLSIADVNPGACYGPDGWIADSHGSRMISCNPATGDPIAAVVQSGPETYVRCGRSRARFRRVAHGAGPQTRRDRPPARQRPARGKRDLGRLVSLEMGKIRAEGKAKCRR